MTHKLYHEKTCIVKYNVRYILSLFSFLIYESNRKKNRKIWEEDESRMGKEKRKKKIWKFKYKKLTWFLVNIFKIKVYYLHLKKNILFWHWHYEQRTPLLELLRAVLFSDTEINCFGFLCIHMEGVFFKKTSLNLKASNMKC